MNVIVTLSDSEGSRYIKGEPDSCSKFHRVSQED